MCLIIDANCFGSVFVLSAKNHENFAPILEWLLKGKDARLIFGGKKYRKEVNFKAPQYRGVLSEIERKGRLLQIADGDVKKAADAIKKMVGNNVDFDDEHIIALVAVSKCCVVCTEDKRSYPFLKRKDLYPKGVKPPKIYRSKRNANLCCNEHVVEICRVKVKS
jgi:hypothetical protein